MEHPHEPMDAIKKWQEWYKSNRVVASLDTPLISKDSRENLHDTSNTMTTVFNTPFANSEWRQSVIDNFADTITEAMADLSGAEIYKCLLQAAEENLKHCEKEYKDAKQLVDYLTNKQ
jgi:hypothetical protein